jgi:tRNA1Val (adenine37-N6)-methyltransferase
VSPATKCRLPSAPPAAGIVRPPRRPVDWCPPGPPPATPTDRPEVWPGPGEDLCHLAGDWRILQLLRGHRWSLDDLVTAWFAADVVRDAPPALVADLGCGIGAVLMLLAWRFPAARGVGIEVQPVSVQLARRSLAWNGAGSRCEVRRGDLRDPASIPEGAVFDLVTATPPYLPVGSAHGSWRAQWAGCHLELCGGVEAYCAAAARLLAPDGWFVTCAGASQDERVRGGAAAAGLRVVRRREIVPRAGKDALFAVWAIRRDGQPTADETPLVVRDRAGRWTGGFRSVRAAMGMPA